MNQLFHKRRDIKQLESWTMLKSTGQCLLIVAIAMLAACDKGVPAMTEDEQRTVQEYTDSLAQVCIGRFMVEMPKRMELAYSSLSVNDAKISAQPMSRQMYERLITRRQRELENMERVDPEDAPFLKNIIREEDLVIFDRNEDTGTSDSGRVLEGYRLIDNTMFKVSVKATDLSDDKYTEWRTHLTDNKSGRMQEIRYLLDNLSPLASGDIPEKPGLCFENGFLAGGAEGTIPGHEAPFRIENVTMRYIDRERKDVYFNITTDSWLHQDTTLLDSLSEAKDSLSQDDNGALLRHGKVALEGIDQAEELLVAMTNTASRNDIRYTDFSLEANSLEGNRLAPQVVIVLKNGAYSMVVDEKDRENLEKPSLTDAEAIGLWDAVTRTFHPRPGAF
ncbi:T6SS immunity protein Tli4 family protein [Halomonas binhaiensis]|uniref:Tle cognate immunity protein 4 C-terminal domain-containing protein n=1 Tax=Halomonas binhaiensis TaxID=2562282 RepID=A0A5C1NJ34_9GAMM|nr:T6SS immunity protein Tli4 family protein [Halomonas binhaiensis]QEM82115.1 hypothetical protein E4T21_11570 [Halomonas binhaiensis]